MTIVGVGASAGGLEALDAFLNHVQPTVETAFVIIQHLDPTHKGILVELLQRSTSMSVLQISDRMKVKPGHVYVIPPNHDLSILNGVLHLQEPAAPRGLRLPIDSFFKALAQDQQERSIGVILSGMGSDGTLGLRAIKEHGGAVFVQNPDTAKFDAMPLSAISAGLADVVEPVEKLASSIAAYQRHVPLLQIERAGVEHTDRNQSGLEKVIIILRTQTGHDFSLYKKSTLYRRIERRMGLHQLPKIADYMRYLSENSNEADLLFKELLIGVTSFFRDPEEWERLKTQVFPALFAANAKGATLRAWVPACSTGEEAYSLAIVFSEALEQWKLDGNPLASFSLQIFATDLDQDSIDKARSGVYLDNIAADVSEERLSRFFAQEESRYLVFNDIREMAIFAPQNLVMDPPFTKLDLILCRNLLIYLEPDLQRKILPLFHYSLNASGFLMLGNSETVGQNTDLFEPLSKKSRIYRRNEAPLPTELIDFPAAFTRSRLKSGAGDLPVVISESSSGDNLQSLVETLLLNKFSPAAVLTTKDGDIVYISGKTGKYLEPATGKANLNIFSMARDGLSGLLHRFFKQALREKDPVTLNNVAVGTNGGSQTVSITLQFLTQPVGLKGMMLIVFADVAPAVSKVPAEVTRSGQKSTHQAELVLELRQSHEELQTTREEMQSSQEELKSANEELQSTNEELQSTNEELTTSKEEMQSMNEEMQTVNHELVAKVDELESASNDMLNLLNSTEIATLFLDEQLKVRRFTAPTIDIFKLIPGDAGRPISDLVSTLYYPQMSDDAHNVLKTLAVHECEVTNVDGRWFTIRIMPYRTQDNHIQGVVITFIDITQSKGLEVALRNAQQVLQGRFDLQTEELDDAALLKTQMNKAHDILKQRLDDLKPGT